MIQAATCCAWSATSAWWACCVCTPWLATTTALSRLSLSSTPSSAPTCTPPRSLVRNPPHTAPHLVRLTPGKLGVLPFATAIVHPFQRTQPVHPQDCGCAIHPPCFLPGEVIPSNLGVVPFAPAICTPPRLLLRKSPTLLFTW